MNWQQLTTEEQLYTIKDRSHSTPQVIFKHSTRCSISAMALNRLERAEQPKGGDFYFLDLIANRSVSNAVAEMFHVQHESPQILIISNGECVYDESHMGISPDEIEAQLSTASR
jgi:bacillithiol system protein YtxJ